MSRLLSEPGHQAIVAHARSVRLIGESRRKDDRIDARALARLVRRFSVISRVPVTASLAWPNTPSARSK